jgi:hypothetical protein
MVCYYNNPQATAETLKDGWLLTGDMARQDEEGFIYLVDRKKDVVITGGENLYPVEIENFMAAYPPIKDVAVIGLPDTRLGEIAAAIVANVLGVGNAATPLAVTAMEALAEGHEGEAASDDMVTFTVLGTAFPAFLPTTVIALRAAAGSRNPFDIVPAVWICSVSLSVFAVLLARGLRMGGKRP